MFKDKVRLALMSLIMFFPSCKIVDSVQEATVSQCGLPATIFLSTSNDKSSPILKDVITAANTNVIDVQQNYAYTNIGNQFIILDITNVSQPQALGCLNLPDYIVGVDVEDDYAFVTVGNSNRTWHIVDISDPSQPIERAKGNNQQPFPPLTLGAASKHLYITDYTEGLHIFSFSDLDNFVEVDQYPPRAAEGNKTLPAIKPVDIIIADQRAYVTEFMNETFSLQVLDISNQTKPKLLGSYQWPTELAVSNITVSGHYAYVATYIPGDFEFKKNPRVEVHVIDISDPGNINEVALFNNTAGQAIEAMGIVENHLFLAEGYYGVSILDVTDPTSPLKIGFIPTPITGEVIDIFANVGQLYIASRAAGLQIFDITDATEPMKIGEYITLGSTEELEVSKNVIYITSFGEWKAVNSTLLEEIYIEVGIRSDDVGRVIDSVVMGNYVYILSLSGDDNLFVADISNIAAPTIIGEYDYADLSSVSEMAVNSNYLYVSGLHGLDIFEISNPRSLINVGHFEYPETSFFFSDIVATEDYVYATAGSNGLWILDVSAPSKPNKISEFSSEDSLHEIAKVGDYVYLDTGYTNLIKVIDVEDPENPKEVNSYQLTEKVVDLYGSNEKLYVVLDDRVLVFEANSFILRNPE